MINYVTGLVKDYIFVIDNLSKELFSVLFNRDYVTQPQVPLKEKHSGLENKLNAKETQ